jgi:hypothetical protein
MLEYNARSEGNPGWGHKLNFSPSETEVLHDFCGSHSISGADCPNCSKPLLRLLSLHAADEALNLDRVRHPIVHLLYCWTCSIPYGEFSYQVNADGSIKILEVPPRQPASEFGPDGPYDGYTGRFPARQVSLQPVSETEQQKLVARQAEGADDDDDVYDNHQVGGYPFIFNPCKAYCPLCSKEMPLLAAISDNATGGEGFSDDPKDSFAGNSGVQMVFLFCRACSVVSAYHSCD